MKQTTLCYIERDGQYLMLHRTRKAHDDNHDKWIGIGGHIEPGETPIECILRETREETGLTLADCRYRGVVREMIDCDEGELAWIDKDRLLSLTLWEGDRVFLALLDRRESFFELTLEYRGESLARAVLDGDALALPFDPDAAGL